MDEIQTDLLLKFVAYSMKKEENSTSIWQETHVLLELKSTADGIESNPNETIIN